MARIFSSAFLVALLGAAVLAGAAAAAGGYEATVIADNPSMYWRLGEPDAATTAADSTGHGFTLTYQDSALLDLEGGIQDDPDTSLFADGSSAATGHLVGAPAPEVFEAWLRANPTEKRQTLFHFAGAGAGDRSVTIDEDGIVHAHTSAYNDQPALHLTGPAIPVTDGFWHYVDVDFEAGLIYVDLTAGPPATIGADPDSATAVAPFDTAPFAPALVDLASSYEGQLDEVALYPTSLTSGQISAHAAAGGLGWDQEEVAGGEESAPPGCSERGLFWKGVQAADGSAANITAEGALNLITTTRQPNRCGTAVPAGGPKRPTFITGQTVRIKLNGTTLNYYVEFGPVQYLCADAKSACWGLYFNFKADKTASNEPLGLNFVHWQPFRNNAIPEIADCNPVGTHGWRLVHVDSTWAADFSCHPHRNDWVRFFTYPDGDYGWTSGWPDVEGFNQGFRCGPRTLLGNCWRREGFMSETHLDFQWLDGTTWAPVPAAVCRLDNSLRWDAQQLRGPAPISIDIFEQHRDIGC